MKVLVLNGPNLNLLGKREEDHYGTLTIEDIEKFLEQEFSDIIFEFFQSNHEGELVDMIQNASSNFDGLLINPGGYAHTSIAIKDALTLCKIPKIEIHLSNLSAREEFRHTMITATSCNGYISGFKEYSYSAGVYLLTKLKSNLI
jgi:3-dehydroquinate dehydratase-2